MSTQVTALAEVHCTVKVTINDPDVIERVTGPNGDEWRSSLYKLFTRDDVIRHLVFNCVANGSSDLAQLDGWADLPASAVSMEVIRDTFEIDDIISSERAGA